MNEHLLCVCMCLSRSPSHSRWISNFQILKRRHEGPRKKAAKEELFVLITHCTIQPPAGVELVASLREHVLVVTPVRL